MENEKVRIGKKLTFYRKRKKLSQLQVAQALGKDNSTISKYEKGYREPDFQTLVQFAQLYGVDIIDLVGEDSMEAEAKKMLHKIYDLPPEKRELLLRMIDAAIDQLEDK